MFAKSHFISLEMSIRTTFCHSWTPLRIFQRRPRQVQACQRVAKAKPKLTTTNTIQVPVNYNPVLF